MRVSGLVVATFLLFSSAAFAQHPATTAAPATPAAPAAPPPSAPAKPPATTSAPSAPAASSSPRISASSSSSSSSSPSVSHSSAPSSPSHMTIHQTPDTPASSPSGIHTSSASSSEAPRATPDQKLPREESGIVLSRHGDESPAAKEEDSKNSEVGEKHQFCPAGPCKAPEPKPVETELRSPACKEGDCGKCPSGESVGKDGACVKTASAARPQTPCPPNETRTGVACAQSVQQCPPNESWNGAACTPSPAANCATVDAQAAALASEVRSRKTQMQEECLKAPTGQQCEMYKQSYDLFVTQYRSLLDGAPPSCRATLPDPLAL
jgi:hypothetical protein